MKPDRNARAEAIIAWWRNLQPRTEAGRTVPGDRAALARLRRAESVMQASMIPATLDLCRRLGAGPDEMERIALIAAALAHVREESAERFARQLGGVPPLMSWLRFQRLIEATEPDAQLTAFRRAITQAKRRANPRDLAESLLDWNDRRRQRWLYDYYHTNDPISASMETSA